MTEKLREFAGKGCLCFIALVFGVFICNELLWSISVPRMGRRSGGPRFGGWNRAIFAERFQKVTFSLPMDENAPLV